MKRIHRPHNKPISMIPQAFRPKFNREKVLAMSMAHISNVDAIVRGDGDLQLLWDIFEILLTWSKVAELLQVGGPEIIAQIDLFQAVLDRYQRTGKVGFNGLEYQLAKEGTVHMDLLAEEVDQLTGLKAAEWAERQVHALKAALAQMEGSQC